jgi:hypothetical protein
MRSILIFLAVSFVLAGCTKFGKNVTVKGRVVNPITGEGIPDIRVFMYKATNTSLPADYKTVKEDHTDSEGSFELNKLGLSKYYVKCDIPGDYYIIGWEEKDEISLFDKYTLSVKKGKRMYANYYVVPYGNYQLIINNINCQGPNDTIIINQTNQVNSFLGINWTLTGCSGYTTALEKAPMGTVYTHYTVIRNGITTEYDVNFEILPNQDNIQTINY